MVCPLARLMHRANATKALATGLGFMAGPSAFKKAGPAAWPLRRKRGPGASRTPPRKTDPISIRIDIYIYPEAGTCTGQPFGKAGAGGDPPLRGAPGLGGWRANFGEPRGC